MFVTSRETEGEAGEVIDIFILSSELVLCLLCKLGRVGSMFPIPRRKGVRCLCVYRPVAV